MLAILLAVLAVLFVKKGRWGFLPGAVCLALSMGIYQAYLSFAIMLSLFSVLRIFAGEEKADAGRGAALAGGLRQGLRYLYMGVLGAGLYYGILQALLLIQGKELAGYQGIDGMVSGTAGGTGLLSAAAGMYRDFLGFTFHGNVLFQNAFSAGAGILLAASGAAGAFFALRRRKNWKNPANEKTARYAEFGNTGEGAKTEGRVAWAEQLTKKEVLKYTPENIFKESSNWYPYK